MPKGTVHELKYLVEIPIPYVDRRGRRLDRRRTLRWRRKVEAVLTECFGGFTPAKAPALNRVQTSGGSSSAPHALIGIPSWLIGTVWWTWSFAWARTSIRRTCSYWPMTRIPCGSK